MTKEIDTMDKEDGDLLPEVYDAHIIHEEETPPPKPLAYKLGRAAGSIIALTGFINRVVQLFRPARRDDGPCRGGSSGSSSGMGSGMGRGRGRGRGQRNRRNQK